MSRAGRSLVAVVALIACSRPVAVQTSPPSPPAPTSVVPPVSKAPPPSPPSLDGVAAWTEPQAVLALGADCHAGQPRPDAGTSAALACSLPVDQSCVYDPCFTKLEDCRGLCQTTCDRCGTDCADGCDGCKAACTDDACRRKCAEKTGACRQGCLATRDSCATAGCSKEVSGCPDEERRTWKARGCTGKCPQIRACMNRCIDRDSACTDKCPAGAQDCFAACETSQNTCFASCRTRFHDCDIYYCGPVGSPPEGPAR